MRTTAEGAPGAGDNTAQMWQRGATRRAILDAARLIAVRNGSADFSLNTVAQEAGFSVTTIFAYFSTKTELFNAIIADDLATLARQMRDSYAFTPPLASPQDEPEPVAPPIAETVEPDIAREPEQSTVIAFAPPDNKAEPQSGDAPKTPPRADAWLERRLRVFEKSLADIETRLATAQQDSGKAISLVEESTKVFGARLDASEKRAADFSSDVTMRLSAAEKRLRENHTELRNNLLNVSMRVDVLEAAAQRIAAGAGTVAPHLMTTTPVEPPAAEKPVAVAADTYLSTARRAAQTAAALAEMETVTRKRTPRSSWRSKRLLLIAAATLVAFIAGAAISFAIGVHNGRAAPAVAPAAQWHHAKTADATPLDRLTALARNGDARAELVVGLRYLKGVEAPVDQPRAAKWIARSAESHDPLGQYWMGQIYEHGQGVSADAAEALRWYQAAAAQGNREAMYDLGIAYAEGLGAQKDFTRSAHWFAQAAALGLTNAQFNIAVLYERGEGVPQSLRDAYAWYAVAAANGDGESKTRIEALATQLNAADLAAAKNTAAAFRPGMPDRNANTMPDIGALKIARAS